MEGVNVLKIFQTERKTIALVTLFLWGFVLVYALVGFQSKYTSQAVVIIKDSAVTNQYLGQDQFSNPKTTSSNSANPVLNTMGLLQSATVRDALWEFFKSKHPEELERLHVKTHRDWMKFYRDGRSLIKSKNQPGTDLISLQFSWPDAAIAQEGLGVILKAFQDASIQLSQREQESRKRFLDQRISEITGRLKAIRQQRSRYKSSAGTINLLSESEALAKSRVDVEMALNESLAKARGKQASLSRYQRTLGLSPEVALKGTAVGLDTSMSKLQDQLYSLSQNYAFLRSTLTEQNPKVQEVKAQIDQVEAEIKAEARRTLGKDANPKQLVAVADKTRGDVVNQMVTDQAEASRYLQEASIFRNHLGEVNQQIRSLPKVEEAVSNLEQEERSLSHALDTLIEKELEASLKEAENQSNVFVVDEPSYPLQAKFPSQLDLILVGLLVGLLGGCVVAWLKLQMHEYLLAEEVRPLPLSPPIPAASAQTQPVASIFQPQPVMSMSYGLPPQPLYDVGQEAEEEPIETDFQAEDVLEEATFSPFSPVPISVPGPAPLVPEIISPIPVFDELEEELAEEWEEDADEEETWDDAFVENEEEQEVEMQENPEEEQVAAEIEQLERLFQKNVSPVSAPLHSDTERLPLPIRKLMETERTTVVEPPTHPLVAGKVLPFASRPTAPIDLAQKRSARKGGVSSSSASGSLLRDLLGI